ncbi:hypothetical protein GCM10010211_15570 [Streptomyces albospinus]|uniref:Secreted protein n=1 Tax=Streptomyces albospinus TaxID=285515 RepID=A0ABQ2USY4_9ACTN|nr:hypothetical protein GCM10010211_15570 [Streptomyces albospinus]
MSVVVAVIGGLLGAIAGGTVRRRTQAVPPAGQGMRAEPLCFYTIQSAMGDRQAALVRDGHEVRHGTGGAAGGPPIRRHGSRVRDSRDARVGVP